MISLSQAVVVLRIPSSPLIVIPQLELKRCIRIALLYLQPSHCTMASSQALVGFLTECSLAGTLVSIALVIYDYCLTLPEEVRLIWQRPSRLSTILYFMLRFLPIPQIVF
ncbi:hypothetical protein K439DRAFT_1390981, partial [Ramaria rubella]